MKRLPPVPLTSEDWAIVMQEWSGRDWKRPRMYPLGHAIRSDRRDAELMLAMSLYGRRRWDMVSECYVFCLPSTCEEWWYWCATGRIDGTCSA